MKRKIFAALLALVMVVTILPLGIAAADAAGEIVRAYVRSDNSRITVDLAITYNESVELELYSNDVLLTTSALNTEEYPGPQSYSDFTGAIYINHAGDTWPTESWTPSAELVPTTVKLIVDGTVMDTATIGTQSAMNVPVSAEAWEAIAESADSIIRAYLRDDGSRITVDMENITYSESVELKLYSGDELLTKSTLNATEYPGPAFMAELTGAVYITHDGDTWPTDEWIPVDEKVPTSVELVIDGIVVDEAVVNAEVNSEELLSAEDWAALSATIPVGADIAIKFDAEGGKVVGTAPKTVDFLMPYGKLPTATKVGSDFIGWFTEDGEYVDAKTIVETNDPITLYAAYEANELGDTNNFPRLYSLNLDWNEGGAITAKGSMGRKNLIIAFAAKRTLDIVPEEGYEIVNVNVNGYDLGAVDQYTIVSAHMAYNVTATFAPKLVEVFTPVYTENFDGETKWVKGGHMDSIAVADGVLNATSTGGDPNINYPEAFGLNCDEIDAIRIKFTNNTENTAFQIFFTNEANPGYSEAGSFKATSVVGENELVIYTAGNELWTGTLSNMRIDLSNGAGSYIVDSITFDTVTMEVAK